MNNNLEIPSEDKLMKIQDILLCDAMELDSTKDMYCRIDVNLRTNFDGACILPEGRYYDFFTYMNTLSVMAWKKYTGAERFYIVLDIKGNFEMEVFGHFKTQKGFQKEWCGRYLPTDYPERTKVIIPCNSLMSTCVSFGLWAHNTVAFYGAYYAVDASMVVKKDVKLAIVQSGDSQSVNGITNEQIYDRKIISDNDKICVDLIPSLGYTIRTSELLDNGYTHLIRLDEDVILSPDSINRLCTMLSIIKDDYSGFCFDALIMDYDRPNIQKQIQVEGNDFDIDTDELDMNHWDSIVKNEDRVISLTNGEEGVDAAFRCVPLKKSRSKKDEKNMPGPIFLNSLFAWKTFSNVAGKIFKTQPGQEFVRIQNILLKESMGIEVTKHMYLRSPRDIKIGEDGKVYLPAGEYYEFFTYYNSLSIGKWKKYTNIKSASLVLDVKGSFDINTFGHYQVGTNIQRENFIQTSRDFDSRDILELEYPGTMQSIVVAFGIFAKTDLCIYDMYYGARVNKENIKKPKIAMVTTTFKKEEFINRNISLLSEHLFSDDRFKGGFYWNIIDNGRTLSTTPPNDHIQIIPNANLGGAGGFARGMMVSLRQKQDYSHILLMDDDVVFIPDSFKRLYMMLSLIKDEYSDYFVSGAMLNMDAPNIQHENTGKLVEEGYCIPLHSGRDLNIWDQVLLNEIDSGDMSYRYAAWWFCCIPTTVATEDNLPLPVFVRGDDMEYSLRNNAKFITMNGISISHMGFVGKFNAPMDFYQSKRNELIVFTTLPSLSKIDSFGCIKELFWQELHKFDYIGAEFLADAVEDFLKGPEWFSSVNLFDKLQEKRKKDNVPKKITDSIRKLIDYETLYEEKKITAEEKAIYDNTYNGQEGRVKETRRPGIIPYNFSYYPGRMKFTTVNYAIDPVNDKYVEFKKDKERFAELKERWEKLEKDYLSRKEKIAKHYQEYEKEITNIDFWDKYIEKLSK